MPMFADVRRCSYFELGLPVRNRCSQGGKYKDLYGEKTTVARKGDDNFFFLSYRAISYNYRVIISQFIAR